MAASLRDSVRLKHPAWRKQPTGSNQLLKRLHKRFYILVRSELSSSSVVTAVSHVKMLERAPVQRRQHLAKELIICTLLRERVCYSLLGCLCTMSVGGGGAAGGKDLNAVVQLERKKLDPAFKLASHRCKVQLEEAQDERDTATCGTHAPQQAVFATWSAGPAARAHCQAASCRAGVATYTISTTAIKAHHRVIIVITTSLLHYHYVSGLTFTFFSVMSAERFQGCSWSDARTLLSSALTALSLSVLSCANTSCFWRRCWFVGLARLALACSFPMLRMAMRTRASFACCS